MQQQFIQSFREAFEDGTLLKCTLSKPAAAIAPGLKNIFLRRVDLKSGPHVAFNFRYETRDEVKNYSLSAATEMLAYWVGTHWRNADLFTTTTHWSLQTDKKGIVSVKQQNQAGVNKPISATHDREKKRWIDPHAPWLQLLGITNAKGEILAVNQHKWRQINKYIEVIDALFRENPISESAHIVDMGSGKGYLTFALYDYLSGQMPNGKFSITGIELRENLVGLTNGIAEKVGFSRLQFLAQDINTYQPDRLDVLIALHACDTATDLALATGIYHKAKIIVAAPCCHKQIRRDMNTQNELAPILNYGILEERQAEIITDGIRALLLEAAGYGVKVFEFISTEHTAKNVMITAVGKKAKPAQKQAALDKVAALKSGFGVKVHYLETLLNKESLATDKP